MYAKEPQLADAGLLCNDGWILSFRHSAAPSHSWLLHGMLSATLHVCPAMARAVMPAPRLPLPNALCDELQHA